MQSKALHLERERDVLVVTIDDPLSPVNAISRRLLDEFASLIELVEGDDSVGTVVLRSGKKSTFIAGANLDEVARIESAEEASAFVRRGHALLDRIANSRKPIVAAIDGAALGGGLEVVLACQARIATDEPHTVLGLPEVMVGLLPAAGGTQRLPRLIGLIRALEMMLTGKRIRARRARQWGLIDEIVTGEQIMSAAVGIARRLVSGETPRRKKAPWSHRLAGLPLARDLVRRRATRDVRRKTRGLYPAPFAILDCVFTGLSRGFEAGRSCEIDHFGRLVASRKAKNLIWIFKTMTAMKSTPVDSPPAEVRRLAVLGAGLMGSGIASVSLPLAEVVLRDVESSQLDRARAAIETSIEKRSRSGAVTEKDAAIQRERLHTTAAIADLAGADLVIEAIFEDLELKRRVLTEVEAVVSDQAIFASNTSALPIGEIAKASKDASRVIGMHYFSPVPKMPLLEIVVTPETGERAIATAHSFGTAQGKTAMVVRDGPGFYTTRILAPYMNEAILLLEEGATIEALDDALRDFGFPVGPVTLLDEVGLDIAAHVARDLGHAFAHRGLSPSDSLPALVEAGFLGRKNKRGFFLYDVKTSRKKGANPEIYDRIGKKKGNSIPKQDMAERLAWLMVNEAVWCLAEGVIRSPRDGDIGAILGLGFPPFRGGPFHYVDECGAKRVVDRMRELASRLGPRFEPASMLVGRAESGEPFYDG